MFRRYKFPTSSLSVSLTQLILQLAKLQFAIYASKEGNRKRFPSFVYLCNITSQGKVRELHSEYGEAREPCESWARQGTRRKEP